VKGFLLLAGPSFSIVALLAGALGFTGIAGAAVGIARSPVFIFLVLIFGVTNSAPFCEMTEGCA